MRAERQNPSLDVWFGGTGDPHLVANEEGLTEFYRPRAWADLRPEFREAVANKYIPLYAGILGWALNERCYGRRTCRFPARGGTSPIPVGTGCEYLVDTPVGEVQVLDPSGALSVGTEVRLTFREAGLYLLSRETSQATHVSVVLGGPQWGR
ncbi:MAG: hypothetical protein QN163_04330 [Armatimonadota bacterium]|nr:hypothetical protein [Armatimonadota bacterium]MDR5698119.1 hypothetical protein [Armatimonadota bacterium]